MLCSFKRMIYPKTVAAIDTKGYMIAIFGLREKMADSNGIPVTEAKVVGYHLPTAEDVTVDLSGRWAKSKHGIQFEADGYEEIISHTRDGIIAYLSSGLIKGIGPAIAEKIYDIFGDDTLAVLDSDVDRLMKVPGIGKTKLERIRDSYMATRTARDIVAFMRPHGVTTNKAVKIFEHYGKDAIRIVKEHPYQLCEMHGIGFKIADAIAQAMGLDPLSSERIAAGILYTLEDAETGGDLCLTKKKFRKESLKLLNTDGITEERIAVEAYKLLCEGKLVIYHDRVYLASTARIEQRVADNVNRTLSKGTKKLRVNLDLEIDREQSRIGITLAPEQREAIKACLTSPLCIVSGGPGTGKTLIQRVLLGIYQRTSPDAKIVCCAPTGRAARRMEQCTGYPASTIHRALGLMAGEDGTYGEPEPLDADFVLVDEVSMLDIYLANHLLNSLPDGCQLTLVGDADQLPSVGPGAVLSELIASGAIPVVKLDKVFRQDAGSRIATNAKLIRHSTLALEYGDDFIFYESPTFEQSADIIESLYKKEIASVGVDNVALLTPLRKKTETGVNALNKRLHGIINPPSKGKPELVRGEKVFRVGDKVMQTRNREDISNGDIGYITRITSQDGEMTVYVDFGDGRCAEYDPHHLEHLELAYASTVHKSQGSEYPTVILNVQSGHSFMLKRPLVYTGITRAKRKVIIVGERKALCIAIKRVDAEKRGTLLAQRINEHGVPPSESPTCPSSNSG